MKQDPWQSRRAAYLARTMRYEHDGSIARWRKPGRPPKPRPPFDRRAEVLRAAELPWAYLQDAEHAGEYTLRWRRTWNGEDDGHVLVKTRSWPEYLEVARFALKAFREAKQRRESGQGCLWEAA